MAQNDDARKKIGGEIKQKRKDKGVKYKDLQMNYRTVKGIEEGTPYEIDSLLDLMAELQLSSFTLNLKNHDGKNPTTV